jgi:cyclopropane fatty-acyl-phospholipid synthase-like methyltransferase
MTGAKHCPPAAQRNVEPIISVLRSALPGRGRVLEIASGSGYHVVRFAAAFPDLHWQPSDPGADARASIALHRADAGLGNVGEPLDLPVESRPWPVSNVDAIVCINMIHIAPWAATTHLFAGAAEVLPHDGVVFAYGPFILDGDYIADSNRAFDLDLKARNPAWGLREVRDVETVAERHGFRRIATVAMPANNLSLVFRRVR